MNDLLSVKAAARHCPFLLIRQPPPGGLLERLDGEKLSNAVLESVTFLGVFTGFIMIMSEYNVHRGNDVKAFAVLKVEMIS